MRSARNRLPITAVHWIRIGAFLVGAVLLWTWVAEGWVRAEPDDPRRVELDIDGLH